MENKNNFKMRRLDVLDPNALSAPKDKDFRKLSFAEDLPTRKISYTEQPPSEVIRKHSTIRVDSDHDKVFVTGRRLSKVSINGVETLVSENVVTQLHVGHSENVRRKSMSYLKKELAIDYHQIPLESLYHRLGTDPIEGLSPDRREINIKKFGKNELTPPDKEPIWLTFLKTLIGGFQLLLWAGSVLSFGAYVAQYLQTGNPPQDNLWMGIVLGALVIMLGLFTFYQEYSSNKVMESFAKMVPSYALVLRNGKMENINSKELAVGDIIEIKFGDSIPADIRIIESSGLKVDNSSLTGESEPQSRSPFCTHENPMETKNLAFFSSNALEGTAKGVVVSVGDGTFIGRIAGLASGVDASETPLSREVTWFVKVISIVVVINGIVFFIVALLMNYAIIDAIIFLIGIIVANVPEGLLVTFTVILALTAKRMTNKNCLVKQLHAVETLGSCSVICSDKTGTLTQNIMTVAHYWAGGKIIEPSDLNLIDRSVKESVGFGALATVARLCSRAKFLESESVPLRSRKINGDASETAILRAMEGLFERVEEFQKKHPKIFEIPFNSANKFQLSIHDTSEVDGDSRYLLVMKGAPERVIKYCKTIMIHDSPTELTDAHKNTFVDVYEELGALGERVIGFCDCRLPENAYPKGFEFNPDNSDSLLALGFRFTGVISMIDPPRPGVKEAVSTCRDAGIKVVMVTGDHPITARAIARSVGIISEGHETIDEYSKRTNIDVFDIPDDVKDGIVAAVCTGEQLTDLSSEDLDDFLRNHAEIVFARVSPQQKLIIVEGFQRLDYIVAVTGDGVNDSPALKRANIGIAMGISGSDVSKQAADLILLDDNFATIVNGVEEGRLIFDNLKKCIRYLLCANTAFLTPFFGFITLKIPLPMGTIPMLMICLGTDILPTISLSYEPPEDDIMKKPPRNSNKDKLVTDKLISYAYGQLGIIEAFAGFFNYFIIMGTNGFWPLSLIGASYKWYDHAINDMEDSYGQEWTFEARKNLEHTCWTGFFVAVVVCQCGNLLISKTRRVSVFSKLTDNKIIFIAHVFMLCLAAFLTYTPGMSVALGMMPVYGLNWVAALPFMLLVIVYDEFRRLGLRKSGWTWYEEEFFY